MIDMQAERVISLTEATKLDVLPRRRFGKRPNVATFYRWAQRGLRGVVLETIQVGGTKCTSVEAIQRFFQNLSQPVQAVTLPITPRRRQESIERAERDLAA